MGQLERARERPEEVVVMHLGTKVFGIWVVGSVLAVPTGEKAWAAPAACPGGSLQHRPRDWPEPVAVVASQEGTWDVVSCAGDSGETRPAPRRRWASVRLPGVSTREEGGRWRAFLETADGEVELGSLADGPCRGTFGRRCRLVFGEAEDPRQPGQMIWTLGLVLGEEGGIASEAEIRPLAHPELLGPHAGDREEARLPTH